MDKKLPKVFVSKIEKELHNNDRVFYDKNKKVEIKDEKKESININQKINKLFNSTKYVYKMDVEVKTKSGIIKKQIIGKNKNSLITMENELIPISDIIDIKFD